MIYAAMLAGGVGSRMGNMPVPKQFYMLGEYPVFIHSIRTFLKDSRVQQLWIGANGDWFDLAQEQIQEFLGDEPRIRLTPGGADREETLMKTLNAICQANTITDEDIVLIHDAVRPFVSSRIINDVIREMASCSACNVVIPVSDTIVEVREGNTVTGMPTRSTLFAGQSPQGFRIKDLLRVFSALDTETRKSLTETTKAFFAQGIPVHTVQGEFYNFKITTPYDLEVANFLIEYIESLNH